MGTEFAGALIGLTLLGVWIDRHYSTGLKGTLICSGLGLVGGMYNFIRQALALQREAEELRQSEHGDGTHDRSDP
ncbi:MAG: AtpZ/AtpI family protein [Phycisphaerae bacterium]